jgi:chromosome partitioning protein
MTAIVSFISQKGGVGKSTLARALAAVAAHGGLKVVLADLDPGQETSVHWRNVRRQEKGSPKVNVVACKDLKEAVAAGSASDLLVLDTPGGVNANTIQIVLRSHLVVLPTGPSVDDLRPTTLLAHQLANEGMPRPHVVAAVCRVLSDDEAAAARSYLQEAAVAVLAGSIPESLGYRIAQNSGRALTETTQRSLNAHADALMESLLSKIGEVAGSTAKSSTRGKKGHVA